MNWTDQHKDVYPDIQRMAQSGRPKTEREGEKGNKVCGQLGWPHRLCKKEKGLLWVELVASLNKAECYHFTSITLWCSRNIFHVTAAFDQDQNYWYYKVWVAFKICLRSVNTSHGWIRAFLQTGCCSKYSQTAKLQAANSDPVLSENAQLWKSMRKDKL